jgi:SAM-dependent methyltransferase
MLALLVGLRCPLEPLVGKEPDWSRRGIGISDPMEIASILVTHLDYVNTWYDRFPKVDLTAVPEELHSSLEFVTCSEVLEHVPPPVDLALRGLADILRPGGVAVISVPRCPVSTTKELYPGLRELRVLYDRVIWVDGSGLTHLDSNPEFHHGEGQTLAFRHWNFEDLVARLRFMGFSPPLYLPWSDELGVPDIPNSGLMLVRKLG